MRAAAIILALVLAGCAGGKRDAPLFTVNVSNQDRGDGDEIVEREVQSAPPARPRVVTRTQLVPTAPPRVCQCK